MARIVKDLCQHQLFRFLQLSHDRFHFAFCHYAAPFFQFLNATLAVLLRVSFMYAHCSSQVTPASRISASIPCARVARRAAFRTREAFAGIPVSRLGARSAVEARHAHVFTSTLRAHLTPPPLDMASRVRVARGWARLPRIPNEHAKQHAKAFRSPVRYEYAVRCAERVPAAFARELRAVRAEQLAAFRVRAERRVERYGAAAVFVVIHRDRIKECAAFGAVAGEDSGLAHESIIAQRKAKKLKRNLQAKNSSALKLFCMAKRKNPAAVSLGKKGAKARNQNLTPEQRSEIARKAGKAGGRGRKKEPEK